MVVIVLILLVGVIISIFLGYFDFVIGLFFFGGVMIGMLIGNMVIVCFYLYYLKGVFGVICLVVVISLVLKVFG